MQHEADGHDVGGEGDEGTDWNDSDEQIAALAELYCQRLRAGEDSNIIEEYCQQYPALSTDIRDIFPTIAGLEGEKELHLAAPPQQIGAYTIIREIGRGGMGVVYEAEQQQLGRRVALKVIAQHVLDDNARRRFAREARLIAQLEHAHVVPIYDYGEDDSSPYFAMRLIRGKSWQESITDNEVFTLTDICTMTCDVADGLAEAHTQGIFHRDIKPGNILCDHKGAALLSDFGLAIDPLHAQNDTARHRKNTAPSSMVNVGGTLRYMAPEQMKGICNARTDVYALGISMLELCTLRPAFPQKNIPDLLLAIKQGVDVHRVPKRIRRIIARACHSDAAQRYHSAEAFASAIRQQMAAPPHLSGRTMVLMTLIGILLILLTLFIGSFFLPPVTARPQQPPHSDTPSNMPSERDTETEGRSPRYQQRRRAGEPGVDNGAHPMPPHPPFHRGPPPHGRHRDGPPAGHHRPPFANEDR